VIYLANHKFEDLTGMQFGKWIVIKEVGRNKNMSVLWECECSCNEHNRKLLATKVLKSGESKSCGCLSKNPDGMNDYKHGKCNTRLYWVYRSMLQRCYDINCKAYKNYGGRGITICDKWLNKETGFIAFYDWAENNGYDETLSIDRINNDGNYELINCKWSTRKEQSRNRRTNILIEINDKKYTLKELADMHQINYQTMVDRYNSGWRGLDLIKPVKPKRNNKIT
jgi:hypothetical protein